MVRLRGAWLCALLAAGCAREPSPVVLQPHSAEPLQHAFDTLRPALSYDSIQIDRHHVVTRLCSKPEACFGVRLERPDAECAGRNAGPFCVTFSGAPEATQRTVEEALRRVSFDDIWFDPRPSRLALAKRWLSNQAGWIRSWDLQPLRTAAIALILLLAPVWLGSVLGRRTGRRLAGGVALSGCVALPAALAAAMDAVWPMVGVWDALLIGALFGAGFARTAHRAFPMKRSGVVVSAAALGAGLILLEIASRVGLPPAPAFGRSSRPHLLLSDAMRTDLAGVGEEAVCSVAYGASYPTYVSLPAEWQILQDTKPKAGATSRVLHLGDSMVAGQGVSPEQSFVGLLGQMQPQTEQVRNGWGGKGPDTYLVVLRDWLKRQHFDAVVLYLFEGNDLSDLDAGFPCADNQSLLVYGKDGPKLRFAAPHLEASRGWRWLLANSPAPYVVRAVMGHSAVAAQLAAALHGSVMHGADEDDATRLQHLDAILAAARDELAAKHIPLTVVVLPDREVIEGRKPPGLAAKMVEAATALHIPALDATPVVREAAARGEQVFLASPSYERPDCHFNPRGHELVAQWLRTALPGVVHAP